MRAKEINFATLPRLRKVAIFHPEEACFLLTILTMCLEEPSGLLHLAHPFFAGAGKGKGLDSVCQGPCKGRLSFHPSAEGDLFLSLLASVHACCLGKGWSLCLKAL